MTAIENGQDLLTSVLKGVQEIKDHQHGKHTGLIIHENGSLNVARIRMDTGMSQSEFADTFGWNVRTLQGWESGKQASAAARQLLLMIAAAPNRMITIAKEVEAKFADAA